MAGSRCNAEFSSGKAAPGPNYNRMLPIPLTACHQGELNVRPCRWVIARHNS